MVISNATVLRTGSETKRQSERKEIKTERDKKRKGDSSEVRIKRTSAKKTLRMN